ncbi:hypothetical protein [Xanthobacter tagetidis]|jgi:hypothetical protein|uniref:Uncharacterized protein n=1 Tax=Xanthobacter tagetidis TaxID=60216 RepID=A0A3L7ABT6_9HYPH|nr:hypothetical protein [Xanthobacter tagetidis]MBB6306125.1 hypothetical protein [Xanthobacter tagetidis]RLP77677.1 hypothetical protein D9R14_13515 [Xanthobacter tagetidis]
MSEPFDFESRVLGHAGFSARTPLSAADPEVLARAVRAHKAGDAVAQAALTLALMFAIGTVAFVLSIDRAAAATLTAVQSVSGPALLMGVTLIGGGMLAGLAVRRRAAAKVAVRRQP